MQSKTKTRKKKPGRKRSDVLAPLGMRQRRYVKARLSGQTKKEAALAAGYSEPMAENAAVKIESKEVRRAFQALARKAVPPEKIVQRLREGLDATRTRPVISQGKVVDMFEEPDTRERREHLVLAAKLAGYFVEKSELEVQQEVGAGTPSERIDALLKLAAGPAEGKKE